MLKDDQTLVEMQPASFATEDDFQRLLASFPALLAGAQIDSAAPRRWVLVAREKSVTDEQDGAARWSVDHLFLDQDGIPTLVEVKRQSDTRIRREVVGQMLDYAANCVAWWSLDEIRASFIATCGGEPTDAEKAIADLIGPEADVEAFWQVVKTNLRAGRIRMLFVADLIPPELRRIVEFLNRQMNPAEILALELRQFEGQGMRTIVPLVHGQTEEARSHKVAAGEKRQWDEASFYAELERRIGIEASSAARQIGAWMRANTDEVWFGNGLKTGSMGSMVSAHGWKFYPLTLWTNGLAHTVFNYCRKPPFDDPNLMQIWAERLATAMQVPVGEKQRQLGLPLTTLADPARLSAVLNVTAWAVSQMRQGSSVAPKAAGS